MMNEMQIINISGVDCYEKDGIAYLKLENVARGLGFVDEKNGVEYVRWSTVYYHLRKLGVSQEVAKNGYIPENIFYRLAMKAKNVVAERFQAKVADEIIPSIRKHGAYATPQTIDNIINNPDFGIRLLTELKAERRKSATLKAANDQLTAKIEADKPKVQFADSVTASEQSITIGELAKILKQNGLDIGRNRLYARLRYEHYLGSSGKNYNIPSQYAMNLGLFEIAKRFVTTPCGQPLVTTTIYATPHGQKYFINKLLKAAH